MGRCWLAIVAVFVCLGASNALWWGVHQASHHPTPGKTETREKPQHQSAKNTEPAGDHKQITASAPFVIKVVPAQDGEGDPNTNGQKHEWYASPEWWVAILTGGLMFVTFGLAFFTFFLWQSTSHLVKDAAATARQELRAYIGHMSKVSGAHFEGGSAIDAAMQVVSGQFGRVKYFDWNYGKTPAHNVVMRVLVTGRRPADLLTMRWENIRPQQVVQIVHPGQNIGRIVGEETFMDDFFLCGVVEYSDIYEDRWRHRFAFSHSSTSTTGGERWEADEAHNDEQQLMDGRWVNTVPPAPTAL